MLYFQVLIKEYRKDERCLVKEYEGYRQESNEDFEGILDKIELNFVVE